MTTTISSTSPNIQIFCEQGVMSIQINRPDKRNALTSEMYLAMADALLQASRHTDIKVVLLQGQADCFTAGNDLADFLEGGFGDESGVVQFIKQISIFDKPLVAAVSGAAVGIGTTMLLHCDLVYADETAKFAMPFSKLGLCAEAASSLLLPRLVGYHKAAEWLLLGTSFGTIEALQAGIINQVISEDVRAYALSKARQLASLPQSGVLATRQLMKDSIASSVSSSIKDEMEKFARLLESDAAKQAFEVFLNKSAK